MDGALCVSFSKADKPTDEDVISTIKKDIIDDIESKTNSSDELEKNSKKGKK